MGFTISGSYHMPKLSPSAFTRSIRLLMPPFSLFSFTCQSPRAWVSSFRVPNQPSSITSMSTPSFFASLAKSTRRLSSKSNTAASQLFISRGRFLWVHSLRMRLSI